MSDKKEHTTQGGVDWELRTAEDGMVAAQDRKALAKAMRRHADGVRNMMQSELVPSFENAIDGIMARHIKGLTELIGGLRSDGQALQAEFRTVAAIVADLQTGMQESREDRQELRTRITAVDAKVATIQERLDAYIAGSRRDDLDALRIEVSEMRGDYTPDQRAQLISTLLHMIAEWRATHPDEAGSG